MSAKLRSRPVGLLPPGAKPRLPPSVVSVPPASTLTVPLVVAAGVPKVNESTGGWNTANPPTPKERKKLALEPAPVTVNTPVEPAALPMKLLQ